MCGIAGFIAQQIDGAARGILRNMTTAIAHRGPDGAGEWFDDARGIALGHRRLAILDLSEAGRQPMVSASGRYVLSYNGEIYNYRDLRAKLESSGSPTTWRGHSDTEVLIAAFEQWGIQATLKMLNGMFALALWDRRDEILTLARDPLGEKPLYFGRCGSTLLFGSELKAITAHPSCEKRINRDALALYLRHNYVPAPYTIWKGISKLQPGHFVEIRRQDLKISAPTPFWDFKSLAHEYAASPLRPGAHLTDELERLLLDSVGLRMESDVPLGAFLSGGIDSSLVVALMQAQSSRPVRTFTIGFDEKSYNEAAHAEAVASHLGTEHTELYVTAQDAMSMVPRLPAIWDEPFADSSQLPTFLLAEMTKKHVTVSLSGDGGDELFGGYNRYFHAMRVWKGLSRLPLKSRGWMASILAAPPIGKAASTFASLSPNLHGLRLQEKLPKVAQILTAPSPHDLYLRLISHFTRPEEVAIGGFEPETILTGDRPSFSDFRQTMMYYDTLTYLPDDILVKVDRAAMAVGLEARVPLLDPRIVEFAWRLPMSAKIKGGKGKNILREVLYRYIPEKLMDRPKMGFGVPIGAWLRGPLRDWAEALLDETKLREDGFLEAVPIREMWNAYASGQSGGHYHLWNVLMFQAWRAEQAGGNADQVISRQSIAAGAY